MKDLMGETQPEGLGEAQLGDRLEGEMAEDFIPKAPWKGMRGIVKEKNGQILQVKEEGGVMLISTPLQPTAGIQGPSKPCPIRRQTLHRLKQCWVKISTCGATNAMVNL